MYHAPLVEWKGGTEPESIPHFCPYRVGGMESREACRKLSGGSLLQNVKGCCGTRRENVVFGPCNSAERRCVVCLQLGRRGEKANVVSNIARHTCDEHAGAAIEGVSPDLLAAPVEVPSTHHLAVSGPGSEKGDDAGEGFRVAVRQLQADFAGHRGTEYDRAVQAGSLHEAHDQRDVEVGVQPP